MSKKLCITKIEIEIKVGKKIELSLAEAKELHEQLHELFGDKFTTHYPAYIGPHWYVREYPIYPTQPYITYTARGTSLTTTATCQSAGSVYSTNGTGTVYNGGTQRLQPS